MKLSISGGRISLFITRLIIVATAISPAFAIDEDSRNLLLIGVMGLSPIIFLASFKRFYPADYWLIAVMIGLVVMPLVVNPESMRWSTVLFTQMFGITYLAYGQLLVNRKCFTLENYQNLLKILIYAYTLMLIAQQLCVLAGLPIINSSNYNPGEPWKLNSFASEPSHSARIVALLMYCYIAMAELINRRSYNFSKDLKHDRWIWMSFLWTMVTMQSGTAFVFFAILLTKFLRLKSVLGLSVLIGCIFFLADFVGVTAYERAIRLFVAFWSFDIMTIYNADPSGAYRVVPFFVVAELASITSFDGWFGHGVDYVSYVIQGRIPFYFPEGGIGGGMLQVWVDFGFLVFACFMIFSILSFFRKGEYVSWLFWFMLVFVSNLNYQIMWLFFILLLTNRYFASRQIS